MKIIDDVLVPLCKGIFVIDLLGKQKLKYSYKKVMEYVIINSNILYYIDSNTWLCVHSLFYIWPFTSHDRLD